MIIFILFNELIYYLHLGNFCFMMKNLTQRHQHIIAKLKNEGSLKVVELCSELNVSSVTIRKDLKLLEDKKLLFRTHGGGTLSNPYTSDSYS
ncbi:MAG: DeoR family transcriptional regulator [Chitinophagaceae bacterium]